jgi:predicted nucleic acid-binding protein
VRTALDSSVLLDVLGADPRFGPASREALRKAHDAGALATCEVVWAEVRAFFGSDDSFNEAFRALGIAFEPLSQEAALLAGRLWRARRELTRRPQGRQRVVADFLIGAHASLQADALLSRDRGFYREYFRNLRVIDPGHA